MATENSVDEIRELFRQAGVDIGGRHLFDVSIATNGAVSHVTVLDINDDVWLWKDSEPLKWMKLPRVPFLERAADPEHPAARGPKPMYSPPKVTVLEPVSETPNMNSPEGKP
jgi:hypothetical protein